MAWQSWIEGQAEILLAPADRADEAQNISRDPANDWSPALAIDRDGNRHVAFDTYRNGNYDVLLFSSVHKNNLLLPVADTPRFEVRPTLAVNRTGGSGSPTRSATPTGVRMPRISSRGKVRASIVPVPCGSAWRRGCACKGRRTRWPALGIAPDDEQLSALAADPSGRIWLLFRHQKEAVWGNNAVMVIGGVWVEFPHRWRARTGQNRNRFREATACSTTARPW